MNELKLLAIKAKSRLLNKGIRDIWNNAGLIENKIKEKKEDEIKPSLDFANEAERKKIILNKIKNRF